jgi:L-Ala-D/L-Glu epimerase
MPSWRSASPISQDSRVCHRHNNVMNIIDIQWHNYRLPFHHRFSTAHGEMDVREGIIVQVSTSEDIIGIGEIAPLPMFAGGDLTNAYSLLPALADRLCFKTLHEALDALSTVRVSTKTASTLCGLDTALLDALGKATGRCVSTLLSPVDFVPRAAVHVNAVIGAKTIKEAIMASLHAKQHGFRCVKLKVGLGLSVHDELERVAVVRDAIGPSMHLRLDANEAWQLEEAVTILSHCVPYDIQYVEQPLKAHDLAGMRTLRQSISIPIAVDEAVHGLESANHILDSDAADILVMKPQLAGGLRIGQQIIQAATEHGARCVITSTIGSGIGLAAELHLAAASPAVTLECGLGTLPLLADDLLTEELLIRDGLMPVPTGPGLGVELDQQALNSYSRRGPK